MSTPNLDLLEMVAGQGFRTLVCDIEHNAFAPERREALVVAAKAMGLAVYFKIEGPEPVHVQRAADLGIDGVIIPHVGRLAETATTLATAKYPPLGTRSYAGGRSTGFSALDADFFQRSNRNFRCLPMIETAEAFEDVEAILAHHCVDGIFIGPFDLALTRGRAGYAFTEADRADIDQLVAAAKRAGKPWWMPAWRAAEQSFALDHGAEMAVVSGEHGVMARGLAQAIAALPPGVTLAGKT
ncbi:aldolase/citrate lyase family protein [Gemmobacter serpentinus]|uniref:aldolase/citrate lyase family protein n=1 Tax=Gemmobacter serpentinus TaxID=2652247 RepID=UPI00124D7BC6|nr:aldolase/citrate lyase family protein [Gemmobacter serpentinus]